MLLRDDYGDGGVWGTLPRFIEILAKKSAMKFYVPVYTVGDP